MPPTGGEVMNLSLSVLSFYFQWQLATCTCIGYLPLGSRSHYHFLSNDFGDPLLRLAGEEFQFSHLIAPLLVIQRWLSTCLPREMSAQFSPRAGPSPPRADAMLQTGSDCVDLIDYDMLRPCRRQDFVRKTGTKEVRSRQGI